MSAGFGRWENLRDASIPEIEDAIRAVTFPEAKAIHLKWALKQLTERCGGLSLGFLKGYRTDKVRCWLERFDGLGGEDERCGSELQYVGTVCDLRG